MATSLTGVRTPRLRILPSPHYDALYGARLERIVEEERAGGCEITLEMVARRPLTRAKVCVVDGAPAERLRVAEVACRVRFSVARWHQRLAPFDQLDALAADDSQRTIYGLRHMRHHRHGDLFVFDVENGLLSIRAREYVLEDWPGEPRYDEPRYDEPRYDEPRIIEVRRPWAHVPTNPPGLVPAPVKLHAQYAGDPIAIQLRGRRYRERFFIGAMRHQASNGRRPDVDAVLNLCEMPNAWLSGGETRAEDRWTCKGEGRAGMRPAELLAEAAWVAERLRAGQRVLVHCYAGLNRSSTVCCAALILLEGLSAEAALARVREHHPQAWPDPYHWMVLRWLATTSGSVQKRLATLAPRVSGRRGGESGP